MDIDTGVNFRVMPLPRLAHLTLYNTDFDGLYNASTLYLLNSYLLPKLRILTFINTLESPYFEFEQSLASQISNLIRYDGSGDNEEEFLREQLPLFSNLESLTFRDALPFKIGFEAPSNLNSLSILFHHEHLQEYQLAETWLNKAKYPSTN